MKSNSLLTYVLYGLLGAFILAAGYYACQRQKEKKEQAAKEAAELEETLRNMGYASEDTTASSGSSYISRDSLSKAGSKSVTGTKPSAIMTKPTVSKTGIENEKAPTMKKTLAPSSSKPKATTPAAAPKTTTTKAPSAIKGPGVGRWTVRAGTFTYMDGARRRLEDVIKAGYTNAEISKTKDGKAAVIVYRSDDKTAAMRIVDKLEEKNIDSAVFDRNN